MKDRPGEAEIDDPHVPNRPPTEGYGGGMSAAERGRVNYRGRIHYNQGPPKATDGGKDLSKNAKNVISKEGVKSAAISPSSWKQSRNRGSKY